MLCTIGLYMYCRRRSTVRRQRSVTHDSLRYINIFTYLLTYLLTNDCLV